MKRVVALLISIIMVFSVQSAYAGTICYVYGNNISSVDFDPLPKVGQIFTDDSMNVLAVRRSAPDAVVFDKLISRSDYKIGGDLLQRHAISSVGVSASLGNVFLSYGVSTPLYPAYALLLVGYGYGGQLYALGGAKVMIPVSRLWDGGGTLIENGKLAGWGACGVAFPDPGASGGARFASCYGFSYRHNIGVLHWEVGASWMGILSTGTKFTPFLGFGADI